MKKYLLLTLTPLMLFAQSYMAKIEPYKEYTLYAQSAGEIVQLDTNDETKTVTKTIVKLDDELEQKQLSIYKKQLKLYLQKLHILEKSYEKYIKITGKSQSDKDDKLYEIIELKISIETLQANIYEIKNTLKKKIVTVKDLYIKEFLVNKGDYVSTGATLAKAYEINKSKIVVYVSMSDIENIHNKKVLINGKENQASIEKIDLTVDDVYVSAYKVTLISKNKSFGTVVNVEFK